MFGEPSARWDRTISCKEASAPTRVIFAPDYPLIGISGPALTSRYPVHSTTHRLASSQLRPSLWVHPIRDPFPPAIYWLRPCPFSSPGLRRVKRSLNNLNERLCFHFSNANKYPTPATAHRLASSQLRPSLWVHPIRDPFPPAIC